MASNYDVKSGVENLERQNVISRQSAEQFTRGNRRNVSLASLDDAKGDPVLLCILIDSSASMDVCRQAVLQSHPIMLDALRGSAHARNNLLFVCQYLFSTAPENLHPFAPLAPSQGGDEVIVLNSSNYFPSGGTALYQTLHSSLQDLLVNLSLARDQGLYPLCSIAVITDGQDTEGGVEPSSIKKLLHELRSEGIFKSSVLVGLINNNLTMTHLEKIRDSIGFDKLVNCGQADDAREIRRAFVMASQSVVAGLA